MTDTRDLAELEQEFNSARDNPDVSAETLLELATAIVSAKKLEAKVIRDAESAAAKAEHDEKMLEITPLLETCKVALSLLVEEIRDKFVKAGIHSFVISAKDMHTDSMLTNVKASGPGLPTAKSGTTGATSGTKRGRNVYTLPDGTVEDSRSLLEKYGEEHFGEKFLDATGFSHRADALAEKLGATKSKRENGDS